MRILHCITRLIVGGSQELVLSMCKEQIRAGHEVILLYGRTDGLEGSFVDIAQEIPGLISLEIATMVPDPNLTRDLAAYRLLRTVIDAYQPDVVHTHTFKAGVLGRIAARRAGIRCVTHTVHGARFFEEQSRLQNALVVWGERRAARYTDQILCVSDALRHRFLSAGIGDAAQYRVIYSGLDPKAFQDASAQRRDARNALGFHDDHIVIGTVGRLTSMKGHGDLLKELAEEMHSDARLHLLWVGDGPERETLERRVHSLGLGSRVHILGMQDSARVPYFVSAMDIMAHPSYREGFPLALVQATLLGVPAVAYDVDGPSEVCAHGESGYIVPKGDSAALAAAVKLLTQDVSRRENFGRQARRASRARCDYDRMMSEVERSYRQVLDA